MIGAHAMDWPDNPFGLMQFQPVSDTATRHKTKTLDLGKALPSGLQLLHLETCPGADFPANSTKTASNFTPFASRVFGRAKNWRKSKSSSERLRGISCIKVACNGKNRSCTVDLFLFRLSGFRFSSLVCGSKLASWSMSNSVFRALFSKRFEMSIAIRLASGQGRICFHALSIARPVRSASLTGSGMYEPPTSQHFSITFFML